MLDPHEVDGAVWISKENLHKLFNNIDDFVDGFIPSGQNGESLS